MLVKSSGREHRQGLQLCSVQEAGNALCSRTAQGISGAMRNAAGTKASSSVPACWGDDLPWQ